MSYFDVVLETLQGIQKELKATRHAILHQTKLLQENPTSANKETNKPKEAAPAAKAITWQEAVKVLRDLCEAQRYCADCPAQAWCDSAVPINTKVITPREWEVPANE